MSRAIIIPFIIVVIVEFTCEVIISTMNIISIPAYTWMYVIKIFLAWVAIFSNKVPNQVIQNQFALYFSYVNREGRTEPILVT